MNSTDWLAYFRQNRLDRYGIAWHDGIHLGPRLQSPLLHSFTLLGRTILHHARLLEQAAVRVDAANRPVLELFVAENREDAHLLQRTVLIATRTNMESPSPSPNEAHATNGASAPQWILTRQLILDAIILKFLAEAHRGTEDPVLQTVCTQVLHDLKFHERFLSDVLHFRIAGLSSAQRRLSRGALGAFFAVAANSFVRSHRKTLAALGVEPPDFLHGARANFIAASAAAFTGIAFERDIAQQATSATKTPRRRGQRLFQPRGMRIAPPLDPMLYPRRPTRRYALLINPFYPKDPHASFGKHVLTPTLALTSVAGATPPDWEVCYWDENLLQGPPPCEPFPQVIGITVHLTFANRAFDLARWYRERGAIVVLGGLHAISCPDECAPHADALAVGDGVQLWPQILRDIDAGRLQKVYQSDFRRPYREDPPPRRELVPRWGFLTSTSLIATRGCHNRCGFCYLSTEGLHMPYLMRDPEQIVHEFAEDDQPYGVFIDNNFGSRPEYLRKLCRALRPLEKTWSAAVTIDITDDPSLVRDMALAGCTGAFIGFESLSDENLSDAHKKTPRTEDYARRVAILHDNGIQVNGSFVLGFDHDRRDVFEQTVGWIEENRLECATFHILTPYPGTSLFWQMDAQGRLLHKDWSRYDTAHVVFRPQHMTPEELADGYAWCYERLFSHRSIWARRPAAVGAAASYLAMSYLYKRSNRFWHFLIRHRLQHAVWFPLVELTRRRHVGFRRRLAEQTEPRVVPRAAVVVSAGV
jgi:radical SAM superfamily enzyme YgiQ (UPF0313 family)